MTDNRDHAVLILTPPTCPRCSTEEARVFLRSGLELVCSDCKAAA